MRWNRIVILFVLGGLLTGLVLLGKEAMRDGTAEKPKPNIVLTGTTQTAEGWSKAEQWAKSVVRLEVYDNHGDRIATGSGFAALDERFLITARHVVVNMEYMTATRDDGSSFRIDRVLAADADSDIAICALPEDAGLTTLAFAEETPPRGTKVVVIGSQFGVINLVTEGIVSGTWSADNVTRIFFTAPVSGGSSGGPLLTSAGTVVGIVTGTYEKGQNLNIAAANEAAHKLCESIID
ncbi:MAG: trypsin-like peptidase domain-containing protein [Lachnospiraceae bacterium]|nr:trypsin-like peptidase domain-containing protein [Lachnospiraceae bacterium]